ncbi:Vacuolar protein sorting-associated protein 5, partial [Cladochytrium tenue]
MSRMFDDEDDGAFDAWAAPDARRTAANVWGDLPSVSASAGSLLAAAPSGLSSTPPSSAAAAAAFYVPDPARPPSPPPALPSVGASAFYTPPPRPASPIGPLTSSISAFSLGPTRDDDEAATLLQSPFADTTAHGFASEPVHGSNARRASNRVSANATSLAASLMQTYRDAQANRAHVDDEDVIPNPLLGDAFASAAVSAADLVPKTADSLPALGASRGGSTPLLSADRTGTWPQGASTAPVIAARTTSPPPLGPADPLLDQDEGFRSLASPPAFPGATATARAPPKPARVEKFVDPLMALAQDDEDDENADDDYAPAFAGASARQRTFPHVPPKDAQPEDDEGVPAAKFNFDVNVTEPQKVSDLINAHVTYKVKTKTDCPGYRNSEFVVTRRYRDFLWLYTQLQERYPGAIVPPVPEKLAIGRFQLDFVETRRLALEKFVRKITAHRLLQEDADLRMFLESETFAVDVNQKKREDSKTNFMSVFTTLTPIQTASTLRIPDDDEVLR